LTRSSTPYTRFIHFIDPDGGIPAQADSEPVPATPLWRLDDVIFDQYFLPIPANAPLGEYQLVVGFYPVGSPFTRLPITDIGKSVEADSRALIKTVTVLP
jgi:hypothetical protein